MSIFYAYYLEIKNRILLIFLSWIATILTSYVYKEKLLFLIIKPSLNQINIETYFIFTHVSEVFYVYLNLIFFLSNHIVVFYMVYHFLIFTSLGLYKYEYLYLTSLFITSLIIWVFSVLTFNWIILPFSWNFFLSFQQFENLNTVNLYFESKLGEYFDFYIKSYYICSVYCQIFLIVLLFFDLIKTNLSNLRQIRKAFYLFFILFATSVTPPDIFSQLTLSTLMVLIYELMVCNFLVKKSIKKLPNH